MLSFANPITPDISVAIPSETQIVTSQIKTTTLSVITLNTQPVLSISELTSQDLQEFISLSMTMAFPTATVEQQPILATQSIQALIPATIQATITESIMPNTSTSSYEAISSDNATMLPTEEALTASDIIVVRISKQDYEHQQRMIRKTYWENVLLDDYESKEKAQEEPFIKPNLDFSGYVQEKVSSKVINGNRTQAFNDSDYKALPADLKEGAFDIEQRSQLMIAGKLNKDIELDYNIEQQPDFPQKTDIVVKIKKSKLQFGDFSKTFQSGELINVTQKINGVNAEGNFDNYYTYAVNGKMRSDADTYTLNGNGGRDYPLRRKPILEGSLQVWVNGGPKQERVDYLVDYYNGVVSFATPKNSSDLLQFTYDYTNPIEDFIPIATRKNFIGVQAGYTSSLGADVKPMYVDAMEIIRISRDIQSYSLQNAPILIGSEQLMLDNTVLEKDKQYKLNIFNGKIMLVSNYYSQTGTTLNVKYKYLKTSEQREKLKGNGSRGIYRLNVTPILKGSEQIRMGDTILQNFLDYKIDYEKGRILFYYPIAQDQPFTITYRQITLAVDPQYQAANNYLKIEGVYLTQFAKAQKETNTTLIAETYAGAALTRNIAGDATVEFSGWPVLPDTLTVLVNNTPVTSANYQLDAYQGSLILNSAILPSNLSSTNIAVNYSYYKQYGPLEWYFSGNEPLMANSIYVNNKMSSTLISNSDSPIKFDKSLSMIELWYRSQSDGDYHRMLRGIDFDIKFVLDRSGEKGQIQVVLYYFYRDAANVTRGFPSALTSSDRFKVKYYYNKSTIPDPGDISHTNTGFLVKYTPNPNANVDFQLVQSEKKYSRGTSTTVSVLAATGVIGDTYALGNIDIVEDSETVLVKGQPRMEKNKDYFVNYSAGKITFKYMAITLSDNVSVKYDYYVNQSGDSSKQIMNQGYAYMLRGGLRNEYFDIIGRYSHVDKNFATLGSIPFSPGSDSFESGLRYKPTAQLFFETLLRNDIANSSRVNLSGDFLKTDSSYLKVLSRYTPSPELNTEYWIDRSQTVEQLNNTVSPSIHQVATQLIKQNILIEGGPKNFKTQLVANKSFQQDDFIDQINLKTMDATGLTFFNQALLWENRVNVENRWDYTKEDQYANTASQNQKLMDNILKRYIGKVTFIPFPEYSFGYNFGKEEVLKIGAFTTQNQAVTTNIQKYVLTDTGYNMNIRPAIDNIFFTQLSYILQQYHKERGAALERNKPDVEDKIQHTLSIRPLNFVTFTYGQENGNQRQNDDLLLQQNNRYSYGLGTFKPLSLIRDLTGQEIFNALQVTQLGRELRNNKNDNNLPADAYSWGSYTTTDFISNRARAQFSPFSRFNYDITYQDENTQMTDLELKTTSTNTSYQQSPKLDTTEVANVGIGFVDLIINQKKSQLVQQKIVTYYNGQTLDTGIASVLTTNGTTGLWQLDYNIKATPFSNLSAEYNNSQLSDYYIDTIKGLKNRTSWSQVIKGSFSPIAGLQLLSEYNTSQILQYLHPSDNVGFDNLPKLFAQKLDSNANEIKAAMAFSFIKDFTFTAEISQREVNEINASPTDNAQNFRTRALTLSAAYNLLKDIIITYTYSFKRSANLLQFPINEKSGNTDRINIAYTPITFRKGNIKGDIHLTYTRVHNWGIGLNDFSKLLTDQTTQTTIATELKELNDISSLGKMGAKLEIPLGSGIGEVIEINADATIIERLDFSTPEASANNYNILAFILTGKIKF